jgi:EpsI family protein
MDQVRSIRYAVLLIIIAVLALYTNLLRFKPVQDPRLPALAEVPRVVGNFIGSDEEVDPEYLEILRADTTLYRTYRSSEGRAVWVFIGYFKSQQENAQIHSPKHCYPGVGWSLAQEGETDITLGTETISAKHLILSNGTEKQIVLYWFSVHDGEISDEFALKWHQMKNSLLRKPQSAAFVRFSTMVHPGDTDEVTKKTLVEFIESVAPNIERILRETGFSEDEA